MPEDKVGSRVLGEITIDTSSQEAYDIVAVHKDGTDVTSYQLNNGQVIDEATAVSMCNKGQLPGYMVSVSKFGEEFIKGKNDGDLSNNLTNKPVF